MHISSLQQAVLATLEYFNIFEYPLTLIEVHRFLYFPKAKAVSLSQVQQSLETLEQEGVIVATNGFYHLPGNERHVGTRLWRYVLTERKMNRLRRVVKLLQIIPSITMVAACNSLGFSNGRATSDIDVFIVSRPKLLWFTRIKAIVLTSLLGVRLSGEDKQNKICLSFYITSDATNLESLRKQPEDPYFVYWLASLVPVYGCQQYDSLMKANAWLFEILPNYYTRNYHSRRYHAPSSLMLTYRKAFQKILASPFGSFAETVSKKIQWRKLQPAIRQGAAEDNGHVVLSSSMLKFHTTDKRTQYAQQWQQAINKHSYHDEQN